MTLYKISACLLIVHLTLGVGLSAIGKIIPIPIVRNFLLMGYPFFCLGMLFRKKEDIIFKSVSLAHTCILIVIGVVETIVCRLMCGKNELYLGSILIASALFIIALRMRNRTYNATIVKLSGASVSIYIIHYFVGKCVLAILGNTILWKYASPIIVGVVSTLISLLIMEFMCLMRKIKINK